MFVLGAMGVRRWAMAVSVRLCLGDSAHAQRQGNSDSDAGSDTLQLHGASFLKKKDSSQHGCHNGIFSGKTGVVCAHTPALPNFAKARWRFAQALQMQ